MMKLVRAGVITGNRKTMLRGKLVTSFVMGSHAALRVGARQPRARDAGAPTLRTIRASSPKTTAWSRSTRRSRSTSPARSRPTPCSASSSPASAVRSTSCAARRAAAAVAPSSRCAPRHKSGTISRIRGALEEGAGIVTSRGDVRHVVTEYGAADLWGKSVRERALALIEIAHPDFRSELLAQAKQRRFVFVDQRVPAAIYPWREERAERLPGGRDDRRAPSPHERRRGLAGPVLSPLERECLPALHGAQVELSTRRDAGARGRQLRPELRHGGV